MIKRPWVTIYVALLAAFAVLAVLAHEQPFFPWDVTLARAWQDERQAMLASAMAVASVPGYPWAATALVLLAAGLLFWRHCRLAACFTVLTSLGDGLTWLLKLVVGRPRPSPDLLLVADPTTDRSFPSGHVVHYVVFYGFVIFLVFTHISSKRWRAALTVLLAIPIVLIGPSRVYLGAHWPSDVLGGYLLGLLLLTGLIYGYSWASARANSS